MPSLMTLNFLRRFPIPTIKTYLLLSVTILSAVIAHALRIVKTDVKWNEEFSATMLNRSSSAADGGGEYDGDDAADDDEYRLIGGWMVDSTVFRILYYTMNDPLCIWVMVNSTCCLVASFGNVLRWFVFGRLRVVETQQLRDRFWTFLFHKFVFVFGVLNVQQVDEVVLWALWFFAVGLFYLLTTLAHDRFKYMSSTAPTASRSMQLRVVTLMVFCSVSSLALAAISLLVSNWLGLNYGAFLAADAVMVILRSVYCAFRYGVYLVDGGGSAAMEASWERRNSVVYYVELSFELAVSIIDGLHHVHMLVWSNIFLSMASLVMCMQLRSIYQDIEKRLRRHRNYRRILDHMDKHYPMASVSELSGIDDACAICWDQMQSARKLPCGHFFHNWLEQDTSCPTCRGTLDVLNGSNGGGARGGNAAVAVGGGPDGGNAADGAAGGVAPDDADAANVRRRFNHFFHFDGGRYARWLPSFSVEVTHDLGASAIFRRTIPDSQLNTMAEQVREMFPQMPVALILEDLRETNSAQTTIENVLDGRVGGMGGNVGRDDDASSGSEFDDEGSELSVGEHDVSGGGAASPDFGWAAVVASMHAARDDDAQRPSTSAAYPAAHDSALAAASGTGGSNPAGGAEALPAAGGSRFSKSSDERQIILSSCKQQMIKLNRRKYLASDRATDLRERYGYSSTAADNVASVSDSFPTHNPL